MTSLGLFAGGTVAQLLQSAGRTPLESYRVVIIGYALLGGMLAILFTRLSSAVEITQLGPHGHPK